MKTLQTITTLLLLFISINATAQEKQNDATWEETIEFLEKYKDNINRIHLDRTYFQLHDIERISNPNGNSKSGSFLIDYFSESLSINAHETEKYEYAHDCDIDVYKSFKTKNCSLINLQDVKIDYRGITVKFLENSFVVYTSCPNWKNNCKVEKIENMTSELTFNIKNNEIRERYFKAFKHLAYLAKEKREAKRKASGDKF